MSELKSLAITGPLADYLSRTPLVPTGRRPATRPHQTEWRAEGPRP